MVTAGDVVFYGTMDGWFKALDARTGKELWRFKVGSGIIGQPITYRGPDGKQYVAVLVGRGRLGRCGRGRRAGHPRLERRAGLRERDEGPAGRDDQGRDALCLRAAVTGA